jgi:hypothetical protein
MARAARFIAAFLPFSLMALALACGETRHSPGEACLRGDDCLSGFCTDRICVAAPPLGQPQGGSSDPNGTGTTDAGSQSGSSDGGSADARGD